MWCDVVWCGGVEASVRPFSLISPPSHSGKATPTFLRLLRLFKNKVFDPKAHFLDYGLYDNKPPCSLIAKSSNFPDIT